MTLIRLAVSEIIEIVDDGDGRRSIGILKGHLVSSDGSGELIQGPYIQTKQFMCFSNSRIQGEDLFKTPVAAAAVRSNKGDYVVSLNSIVAPIVCGGSGGGGGGARGPGFAI